MDLPGVEHLLAKNHEIWEAKYNKFVHELSGFVNKELNEFSCSIVTIGESINIFCISITHVCKDAQATS